MDKTAVLDLSEALNRADGDRDLFLTLAGLFLQESSKEIASARAALEQQDHAGLAAAAHKLKGSVMEMCAPRLFESTKRLEELGRQGELTKAWPVCADVETRLVEVHAVLRELIAGGFPS
ncbi:MAG TPA: Hpt domain-containing protein [Nitrospiraceae bacterium]|nr:Hpt domain-containing protein [Nitrospiraceae bacterium]